MRSNFRPDSEPSWARFWADLEPILGSKLVLFGLKVGAFFGLVFDTLCKTILERFWCHLGAQVGGKKMLKLNSCQRFLAFRSYALELVSEAVLETSWGGLGAQVGLQKAPKSQIGDKTAPKTQPKKSRK